MRASPTRRARRCTALFLAMITGSVEAAAQQQPAQAELDAQVQHGIVLRDAGQADAAIEHLRRVWESTRYPRALAQLGVTEQTLGRWTDADRHFREVLALTTHPWVAQNRSRVEQSLAAVGEHLGDLEITGIPAGTEVWVDEQRVATMPTAAPLRLTSGSHALELRAVGFMPARRTVSITARALTREVVTLVREGSSGETTTSRPPVVLVDRDPGAAMRIVGWVSVGIATVGVGVGVTGLLLRERAYEDFDASCGGAPPPDDLRVAVMNSASAPRFYASETCRARAGDVSRWATTMGIGFGAAGAFTFAGLALLLLAPPRERAPRASVACAPSLASLQCVWRF